jgi:hypothetical protein
MVPYVYIDKNRTPEGVWELSIVVENVEGADETHTSKVVAQLNLHFEAEPQIQYLDWT